MLTLLLLLSVNHIVPSNLLPQSTCVTLLQFAFVKYSKKQAQLSRAKPSIRDVVGLHYTGISDTPPTPSLQRHTATGRCTNGHPHFPGNKFEIACSSVASVHALLGVGGFPP